MSISLAGLAVSRETEARLHAFGDLLRKWNARINLVAPGTIASMWDRHIIDSAQVFALAPMAGQWVDLGSGGGLPGLVCAILAQDSQPTCRFTLIESDQRKAAFLLTAATQLGLNVQVLPKRAEQAQPQGADVVTARALAALPVLFPYVERHLHKGGVALLPKGKNYAEELEAARREWQFDVVSHPSQTDPAARILEVRNLSRG